LAVTSCDKNFEEINTDPNNPVAIESGLLIADAVFNASNQMYSTFVGGDMGACWSQQWAKVQYNDEALYTPRESVIQGFWDTFYEDLGSDANTMYNLAVEEENANMQGVALVLKAFGFSVLTDCYGDIPFSEAYKSGEGILKPKYDAQADVYNGIIAMLDQADGLFSADGGVINAQSDLIYAGDWSKWQKFANTLKFRVLMRMSGKTDVSTQLAQVLTRPVFTSQADDAELGYLSADPVANPMYESIVYVTREEYKVCEVLVNYLDGTVFGTVDPRLSVYVAENTDGEYRGKPAGIFNVPNDDYNYNNVSPIGDFYLEAEFPGIFLSYTEFLFLKAEAAHKGYISGDANAFYQAGITSSMADNDISSFTLPSLTGTDEDQFEQICVQKWLGLYCQGIEAWTEWRRTGYPELSPAIDAVLDEIPSRWTYPATEQSLNSENYNAAIANQGTDLLTTKVWWNK
jgi:hypothetical protein